MRISDGSSDVCSSDLEDRARQAARLQGEGRRPAHQGPGRHGKQRKVRVATGSAKFVSANELELRSDGSEGDDGKDRKRVGAGKSVEGRGDLVGRRRIYTTKQCNNRELNEIIL